MTLLLAEGIAVTLLVLAIMQASYVCWFIRFLFMGRSLSSISPEAIGEAVVWGGKKSPTVAIVLCLRGGDPSLKDCLRGISLQDYSNFQLHLVVDDLQDPALEIVRAFFAGGTDPEIHVITELSGTCSLKCAALRTALAAIPLSVEAIAFLDADTVTDPNWLRDLIAPLADPTVGATTGNRWFDPLKPTLGAYVRQVWNAAALVQMDIYNIAWGGSLAIKRSTLETTELLEKWGRAFCEDTMLSSVLKKHDLRLIRVPNLICENTESANLSDAYRWIIRQLVTTRLHHPSWLLVQFHGLMTIMGSVIAPLAVVVFYLMNDLPPFYVSASALLAYQSLNVLLLLAIEKANRRVMDLRGSFNQQQRAVANLPLKFLAMVVVQYVHPLACWTAGRAKVLRWRGIDYEIGLDRSIGMQAYEPYREYEARLQNQRDHGQSID